MKKSLVALLLIVGAVASSANLASAALDDVGSAEGLKLMNGQMAKELASRAARLGTSTGGSPANDTLWVGYTPNAPGSTGGAPANYWSIHSGFGKDGYYRPTQFPTGANQHKGTWDFEGPVRGDSLQGWWPIINLYASGGGQTRTDWNRPWWCLDFGNMANYKLGLATTGTLGRTNGVCGVWHRDGGSLVAAPGSLPTPNWTPSQGSYAAWMGLRAHGDRTGGTNPASVDPITQNPHNEDVMEFTSFGAVSASGNDQAFPGYGSQMDQMLYRDIDMTPNPAGNLTIRFRFRTVLSTGVNTAAATRSGWFDSDPLGVVSSPNPGGAQVGNFISSSQAGDALAPRDSFMVYIGSGVDGDNWLPAAGGYPYFQNLPARPVYDPQRRWFGEVLHWDRDPASPAANPRPKFYKQLLSVTGNWPNGTTTRADSAGCDTGNPSNPCTPGNAYVDTTFTIPNAVLVPIRNNNKVRLVFRVKTNRGFDDQGTAYTSNRRGAAVVDRVSYTLTGSPENTFGDFENASDINNDNGTPATAAWKSTGKPPQPLFHTHALSNLQYGDLCGQPGTSGRQCNMAGIVIAMGDHDNGEALSGQIDGSAQREINDGLMSPTIKLAGPYDQGAAHPNGRNLHGFLNFNGTDRQGDINPSEDIWMFWDVFTAAANPFTKGALWRYAAMSYPANSKNPDGPGPLAAYPAWGQMRFPGFIVFNPDPQCIPEFEQFYQQGLIRTSNASGIPDSIRVSVGKTQQCFRFGVSADCAATDGFYKDNISVAFIDGTPAQLTADIWQWINDSFPARESDVPPLPDAATASFDTSGAHVMTGLNISQAPPAALLAQRFDIPGDSTSIIGTPNTARVDMVFRILPGPGNYISPGGALGRPDQVGAALKNIPQETSTTPPAADGSVSAAVRRFWAEFRANPGVYGTPGGHTLPNVLAGWNPNAWNSMRCDTAEANLFARQAAGTNNVLGGPADDANWMSTIHEDDPKFNVLGINHNRCFVIGAADPPTSVQCTGVVPAYISSRPEHADVTGTTREGTKIIPDGLLTPGSHVEYFFRASESTADGSPASGLAPDTSQVFQAPTEGNTDGHRWQEFSVLPNMWKKSTYFHPVMREFGAGLACMLVVDNNDRRGNERVWVSVSDTIGATPQAYWGAHNGWHAVGDGGLLDNPADNRRGEDNQPGYVAKHIGQPGSGSKWDMFQIKASESLTTSAGSIGSRLANRTPGSVGSSLAADQSSRQGPTRDMLAAYYDMMLYLTGDLNSGILGPYSNRSQNDAGMLIQFLQIGTPASPQVFWAVGDGFSESNIPSRQDDITRDFMRDYLGTGVTNTNYAVFRNNRDQLAQYRLLPQWQNKGTGQVELFGMRNLCLWTNDVLKVDGVGLSLAIGQVTSQYAGAGHPHTNPSGSLTADAGVYKASHASSPYITLVEGWDLEHLTHPKDVNTRDRNGYFYKIFLNAISQPSCVIQGTPMIALDVPNVDDGELVNFVNLHNNPLKSGRAKIHFGLTRADRVEVKIFDVSGRLVRTLADRQFAAGTHDLVWDGVDNTGNQVSRGVYFTQVKYQNSQFNLARKLVVLK
jgi:hypothetical protein